MTETVACDPLVTESRRSPESWRKLRYGLLVLVVGIAAGVLLMGSSPSSLADLKAGIAAGRVDEVHAAGALPPGATGYSRVVLLWRDGFRDRYAEVIQLSDVAALPPSQSAGSEPVIGSLTDQLRALNGSLRIITDDVALRGSFVAGWRVPGWLLLTALLTWAATLVLLRNCAEPWWATRWSWFWAIFSPAAIFAVPLFLLLAGPPPGIPYSAQPGRRLTGGWALLLIMFVSPAIGHAVPVGV